MSLSEQHEEVVMSLVGFAGEARSMAFEALKTAREGDLTKADELLEQARKTVYEAHHVQTELIQKEINGESSPMSLLMVHAQDHLMTALLAIDLIAELILDKKAK